MFSSCENSSSFQEQQPSEVSQSALKALKWYSNLPIGSFPDIAWEGERAFMRNKESHLDRLRKSGFFTSDFTDSLKKEYNTCEEANAYSEVDHFPCLESCEVICFTRDSDSSHLSISEELVDGDKAFLVARGFYRYDFQNVIETDIYRSRILMKKENGRWLIDKCTDISTGAE